MNSHVLAGLLLETAEKGFCASSGLKILRLDADVVASPNGSLATWLNSTSKIIISKRSWFMRMSTAES